MRHAAARRLLPDLLDHALAPGSERAVRAHARECARCRRRLTELELCESLVARLPLTLIPLEATGDRRLGRLARWTLPRPDASAPTRRMALEGVAAAAAAGLFAGMLALAGAVRWLPAPPPTPSALALVAFVTPGAGPN